MESDYLASFHGSFTSALRWHHLDALWQRLRDDADSRWYIYAVGETPPDQTATADMFMQFLDEIYNLLRKEHEEDYCGIVYADDLQNPTFVKIYDPHNLGVSCGFSHNPPLPGWVLSRLKPIDLPRAERPTRARRHWWQRIFE